MKRGQATQTMMLVVSVIVALAILAALMQILGMVKLFNPTNPKQVLAGSISSIYQKGYGMKLDKDIVFTKGDTILTGELVAGTSLPAANLHFHCATDDDALCGEGEGCDKPVCIISGNGGEPDRLIVNKNAKLNAVTCINDDKEFYSVYFARHAQDASDACASNIEGQLTT